jgi:hypothetical protein
VVRVQQQRQQQQNSVLEEKGGNDEEEDGRNALAYGFGIPKDHGGQSSSASDYYRSMSSVSSLGGKMRHGVLSFHPNENVSYCKSSSIIQKLHTIVGDEVLRTIFLHTQVLLPIQSSTTSSTSTSKTSSTTCDTSVAIAVTDSSCHRKGNYLLLCGPPLKAVPTIHSSKSRPQLYDPNALDSSSRTTNRKKRKRKRHNNNNNVVVQHIEGNGIKTNNEDDDDDDVHQQPPHQKKRRQRKENSKTPIVLDETTSASASASASTKHSVVLVKTKVPVVVPMSTTNHHRHRHSNQPKLGPNDSISRFPLFYFDNYIPHVGLPRSHPFVQCCGSSSSSSSQPPTLSGGRKLYEILFKAIFEDHGGKGNNNNNNRKRKKKNQQRRLRKRLVQSFPTICDQILQGHTKCDYPRLLERYCSIKQSSSVGLALLQQDGTSSNKSNKNRNILHDGKGNDGITTNDTRLAQLAQAYTCRDHVVAFVGSTLKRVFPIEFWGTKENFNAIMNTVHAFIHLRKKERLANKNLLFGIRVTKIKWLFHIPGGGSYWSESSSNNNNDDDDDQNGSITLRTDSDHHHRRPKSKRPCLQRSNHEVATRLTLQVFRWVFQGFIIPLLRSNFYVTETEFTSQQVQYYRKPIWARFRSLSMNKLLHTQPQQLLQQHQQQQKNKTDPKMGPLPHFEQISYSEAKNMLLTNSGRQMGLSRLRLLPKSTGMRPIAQLSRSQNPIKILFPPPPPNAKSFRSSTSSSLSSFTMTKRSHNGDNSHNESTRTTSKRQRIEQNIGGGCVGGPYHPSSLMSEQTGSYSLPYPRGPSRLPINMILGQVFDVLRYECSQRDRPFGVGMDSLASFYPRYHDYIRKLRMLNDGVVAATRTTKDDDDDDHHRRKLNLYFGSVDIEKCYDRMNQDWLLRLVEDLIPQNSYVVQQLKLDKCSTFPVTQSSPSSSSALTTTSTHYKKFVRPLQEYNPLHTGRHPLMHRWEGTVFDLVKCTLSERTKIVSLLEEHIRSHLVITGGRYQRKILLQASGISQGSVLSTTLCNLYYGVVEKAIFSESDNDTRSFGRSKDGSGGGSGGDDDDFMARFVDDFIFISPRPESVRTFLAKSCRGKPDLGAVINPDKSLVSSEMTLPRAIAIPDPPSVDDSVVEAEEEGINPPDSHIVFPTCDRKNRYGTVLFPWCGFLFDTDTGEVRMDYERFFGGRIRNSLTVDFDGKEGTRMKLRMQSFVVPRCLPILYDSVVNSYENIVTNFYQMMLLAAAKTVEYLRTQNDSIDFGERRYRFAGSGSRRRKGRVLPSNRVRSSNLNVNHLIRCIGDLSTFASWNIQRILKNSCPSTRHSKFCIHAPVAEYLTWMAYHNVFSYVVDFKGIAEQISSSEIPKWLLVLKKVCSLSSSTVIRNQKLLTEEYLRPILAKALEDFQLRHMISRTK